MGPGSGSRPAPRTAAAGPSTTGPRTAPPSGAAWRPAETWPRRAPTAPATATPRARARLFHGVDLEQVRAAGLARRQPGRDSDLVARRRQAGVHGGIGTGLDQLERLHRLLVELGEHTPQELAAPDHASVGREGQNRSLGPVGGDEAGSGAGVG